MLHETEIHFEVLQEYSSGARGEKIVLGNIKLDLAEYVDASDKGTDGVTRRYLMQESKINSTLKVCGNMGCESRGPNLWQIGIRMKQTEGDTNFTA